MCVEIVRKRPNRRVLRGSEEVQPLSEGIRARLIECGPVSKKKERLRLNFGAERMADIRGHLSRKQFEAALTSTLLLIDTITNCEGLSYFIHLPSFPDAVPSTFSI